MTLPQEQVIRMQVEIMQGRTWETRTAAIPASEEAEAMWGRMAADIQQAVAQGLTIDIPNE